MEEPEVVVAALRRRFPSRGVQDSPAWAVEVRHQAFVVADTATGAYLLLAKGAKFRG